MVFCSGCIFLTIAASFFTVLSFDRAVRLLLNFCKKSLLVMGFNSCEVGGLPHYRSVLGCLFLSLLLPLPRKVPGIHEAFCLLDFPLRRGTFFTCTCWALLWFCYKNPDNSKIVSARGTWNWSGTNETTSKMLVCKIPFKRNSTWRRFC